MKQQGASDTATHECLARTEEHVRCRLTGIVRDFQLVRVEQGLILRGHAAHLPREATGPARSHGDYKSIDSGQRD